jgi:hypothetical protein
LQEISEFVVTTSGSGSLMGSMTLELEYLGSRFPLTMPIKTGPNATNVVCTVGAPEASTELLRHLNTNRLYYNQEIWKSLDASTTALLLSKYHFEDHPVANLIDPNPLQIAGNYLVFRMPGFVARRNLPEPEITSGASDDASHVAWKKWLREKGLSFGAESTVEQLVPISTGGVFAEAVLGRSNSAEKLDATRFWNWQDSPIPLQPTEIAAINVGSRAESIDLRPGQLGQPVLNIVNPTSLPDPAGLGAIVGALQNGNMFRDMSAAATTIGLAQATGSYATSAAVDAMRTASTNMQIAAAHDIEAKKIELAKEALKKGGSTEGTPKNISEMGSLINSAGARDAEVAASRGADPLSSSTTASSSSPGSDGTYSATVPDYMPGVPDSARRMLGSAPSGESLRDDAFKRALHGALGVPVSDLVLADSPINSAGSKSFEKILSDEELLEYIHKVDLGLHIVHTTAEIIETFHHAAAWPEISTYLKWSAGAAEWATGAEGAALSASAASAGGFFRAVAIVSKITAPLAYATMALSMILEAYQAFTVDKRLQTKMGYCYGLVWAAVGMNDVPRDFEHWAGRSPEELREAWEIGIREGREKFKTDAKLRNQVLLRLAYEQMRQERFKLTDPEYRVLNSIWVKIREKPAHKSHLPWVGGVPGEYFIPHEWTLKDGSAPTTRPR